TGPAPRSSSRSPPASRFRSRPTDPEPASASVVAVVVARDQQLVLRQDDLLDRRNQPWVERDVAVPAAVVAAGARAVARRRGVARSALEADNGSAAAEADVLRAVRLCVTPWGLPVVLHDAALGVARLTAQTSLAR